jgi:AAA+ superfamily predicted ATPase
LNRVKDRPYIEGKDYNGGQFEVYAKESWKEYLTRNRSIIVDLFQG